MFGNIIFFIWQNYVLGKVLKVTDKSSKINQNDFWTIIWLVFLQKLLILFGLIKEISLEQACVMECIGHFLQNLWIVEGFILKLIQINELYQPSLLPFG